VNYNAGYKRMSSGGFFKIFSIGSMNNISASHSSSGHNSPHVLNLMNGGGNQRGSRLFGTSRSPARSMRTKKRYL